MAGNSQSGERPGFPQQQVCGSVWRQTQVIINTTTTPRKSIVTYTRLPGISSQNRANENVPCARSSVPSSKRMEAMVVGSKKPLTLIIVRASSGTRMSEWPYGILLVVRWFFRELAHNGRKRINCLILNRTFVLAARVLQLHMTRTLALLRLHLAVDLVFIIRLTGIFQHRYATM